MHTTWPNKVHFENLTKFRLHRCPWNHNTYIFECSSKWFHLLRWRFSFGFSIERDCWESIFCISRHEARHFICSGGCGKISDEPKRTHCKVVSRIMNYMKGSLNFAITFNANSHPHAFPRYYDSNYVKGHLTIVSHALKWFFGQWGLIAQVSRKQSCTTNNKEKSKYIVGAMAMRKIVWLRWLLQNIGFLQRRATSLDYRNNWSCILMYTQPRVWKVHKAYRCCIAHHTTWTQTMATLM